jgi:hypothetical protein
MAIVPKIAATVPRPNHPQPILKNTHSRVMKRFMRKQRRLMKKVLIVTAWFLPAADPMLEEQKN